MSDRWKPYAQQLYKIEEKYQPKVLKAIRAYYAQFISDLAQSQSFAVSQLQQRSFNNDMTNVVRDIYRRVGLWGAKLSYTEVMASSKEGQKAGGFGRNEEWVRAVLQALDRHGLRLVQYMTETTREDILKLLQEGTEQNLTIEQIIRTLRTSGIAEHRASVITRTEISRAANIGHAEGAKSTPFEVNKKWISAADHRTRRSHILINQSTIDENAFFSVAIEKNGAILGHEDMLYPGDPEATPGNTINCRCRVVYRAKRDAQGNLIRRNNQTARIIPLRRPVDTEDIRIAIAASIKALPILGD